MSFEAIERMPAEELARRHGQCRELLPQFAPNAEGLAVFSRVNVYYMTGTMAQAVFWLPLEGEPVLLLRRGEARARLESPLQNIFVFKSYSQLPAILAEAGSPLGKTVAVEAGGLSWSLGQLLASKLPETAFVPGDAVLARSRARKGEWELRKMRLAGERHHKALYEILPQRIRPGMTEREISCEAFQVFMELGHSGHMRMGGLGDEIFLGHVAAGDSANYPSVFDGPVGLRGVHPAIPFMGYAGQRWNSGEALVCDIGFCLEAYQTDKTQVYWAGATVPDTVAAAHDFCVEMQNWTVERLKPGAVPSELYAHCVQEADRRGFGEGFMALQPNKVAFLGHGIGLAIDEYPVLAKGFDEPLEAGMTVALEPKFGVPGLGMVGVENTFEVTENGGRCLTGDSYGIVCLE